MSGGSALAEAGGLGVQAVSPDLSPRPALDAERELQRGAAITALNPADVTLARDPKGAGTLLLGQTQCFAIGGKVHAP